MLGIPGITVSEVYNESHPATARTQVKSICDDAQKARYRGQILTLQLTSDVLELSEEQNKPHASYNASKSLADFLSDTAQDEDARMQPVARTILALNIVSSVLQLRPTVWCQKPWNSKSIKFPTKAVEGSYLPVCTPYVEQDVDTVIFQNHKRSPDLSTQAAKATMLELGILILEIMHHKSMEAWAAKRQEGDTETSRDRMHVATRWLEQSKDEGSLLPDYIQAIEQCLVLCARSSVSWDDQFQREYCENIIKPLQQIVRGCKS